MIFVIFISLITFQSVYSINILKLNQTDLNESFNNENEINSTVSIMARIILNANSSLFNETGFRNKRQQSSNLIPILYLLHSKLNLI